MGPVVGVVVNVALVLAGAAVGMLGMFGEGRDRDAYDNLSAGTGRRFWTWPRLRFWTYTRKLGWWMIVCTVVVAASAVAKYKLDLSEASAKELAAQAKEVDLAKQRDDWHKKADDRDKNTQDSFDELKKGNGDLRKDNGDLKSQLVGLHLQYDKSTGEVAGLRHQLEELKKDADGIDRAVGSSTSTTSASVVAAREALREEIDTTTRVLDASVVAYNDRLYHLLSEMRQLDVVPIRAALDGRGRSSQELPTLLNIQNECASEDEVQKKVEAALLSAAAKGLCGPCICRPAVTPSASVAPPPLVTVPPVPPAPSNTGAGP